MPQFTLQHLHRGGAHCGLEHLGGVCVASQRQPRPFTICQNREKGSLPIVLGRTLHFWSAFMRSTLKKS